MKKIVHAFVTILILSIPYAANADTDPFAKGIWYRNPYKLQTSYWCDNTQSNGQECYYSVFASFPNTDEHTDFCKKTSATTLDCPPLKASVSYNTSKHSVTLTSSTEIYIYYEEGYLPKGSPMSGTWTSLPIPKSYCSFNTMVVPYADKEATKFFPGTEYEEGGYRSNLTFTLNKDDKGTLFFNDDAMNHNLYLYDASGKQITDMSNLDTVTTMKDNGYYPCIVIKGQ